MARERATDPRFDFREGVNTVDSPEILGPRVARWMENGRGTAGAVELWRGSRRIHDTQIGGGASLLGVVQWEPASGVRQVVAIGATAFYYKNEAATDFVAVPYAFDATKPVRFLVHRVGAAVTLYVANNGIFSWDGVATYGAVAAAPAGAQELTLYQGRGYAHAGTKKLYGSAIQDLTKWATVDGGIEADVETYDSSGIVGLCAVGSSLAIAKEDNVARLTGIDRDDIRIQAQTRGISAEQGLAGINTFIPLESSAFGLSDRGPFVISEGNLDATIGRAIEDRFLTYSESTREQAIAVHHRARGEVWLFVNGEVWAWHYGTRTWHGPRILSTGQPQCACRYERADGSETILCAGGGWVWEEDAVGVYVEQQSRAGAGGTAYGLELELPPLVFGDPDGIKKLGREFNLVAEAPVGSTLTVAWSSEMGSGSAQVAVTDAAQRTYRFRFTRAKGQRFTFTITASGGGATKITGIVPDVAFTRRRR